MEILSQLSRKKLAPDGFGEFIELKNNWIFDFSIEIK
jgi:hypothetical protein